MGQEHMNANHKLNKAVQSDKRSTGNNVLSITRSYLIQWHILNHLVLASVSLSITSAYILLTRHNRLNVFLTVYQGMHLSFS